MCVCLPVRHCAHATVAGPQPAVNPWQAGREERNSEGPRFCSSLALYPPRLCAARSGLPGVRAAPCVRARVCRSVSGWCVCKTERVHLYVACAWTTELHMWRVHIWCRWALVCCVCPFAMCVCMCVGRACGTSVWACVRACIYTSRNQIISSIALASPGSIH